MFKFNRVLATGCMAVLSVLSTGAAAADTWPSKPVTVIIPYPAGGAADVVARILTTELSQQLGAPFIAEPKPGANSNIAAAAVAKAAPDGYTLLISGPWFAINQFIETGRRWEPSDFTPIARFAVTDNMMAVSAQSPVKSLADYVKMAKEAGDKPLQYASPGTGSTQRMAAELFQEAAGIKLQAVQYKGAPPILPDLVSNRVSMSVLAAGTMTALAAAGNLRPLATFGEERGPNTPEVPTMLELGYKDAIVPSWFGLHAPAGTPSAVIDRLSTEIGRIMAMPETKSKLLAADAQSAYLGAKDFGRYIEQEEERWGRVANNVENDK